MIFAFVVMSFVFLQSSVCFPHKNMTFINDSTDFYTGKYR